MTFPRFWGKKDGEKESDAKGEHKAPLALVKQEKETAHDSDEDHDSEEEHAPRLKKRERVAKYFKEGLHVGKSALGAVKTAAVEGAHDPLHGGRHLKKAMRTIAQELKRPVHEIADDIKAARLEISDLLVYELRECGAKFHRVLLAVSDAPEKFRELMLRVKEEWIPDLVEKCKELIPKILDVFMPAGVKRAAQMAVKAGAEVTIPAYCVPIAISGEGKVMLCGSIARDGDGNEVEFEVGMYNDVALGVGVGFGGPVTAKVGGKVSLDVNQTASIKVHLDEIKWTSGFVGFLRSGDYKEAFKNLWDNCKDAILNASQIGLKAGANVAIGVEGEVGVPYVSAGAEAKVGVGAAVEYEGASRGHDGHVEIEAKAFADIEARAGLADLPIDGEVAGFVSSILAMLQASGSFHGEVGARLHWKILKKNPTKKDITEGAHSGFEYVEIFGGTGIEHTLIGNTLKLEAEGGLRFTKESISQCWGKVKEVAGSAVGGDESKKKLNEDGTANLIKKILPFDSFALKLKAHGDTSFWPAVSTLWLQALPSLGDLAFGGKKGIDLNVEFAFDKEKFFQAIEGQKNPMAIMAKMMTGKLEEADQEASGKLNAYILESCEKAQVSISSTRSMGVNVDAGVVKVGVEAEASKIRTFDLVMEGKKKESLSALIRDALGVKDHEKETDGKVPANLKVAA